MVAAFDFCAFGKGGAAPSIDTAMHGLVEAAHVDHLHPDAGIAFATAADGEKLTRECFGDRVAWVPWRRPGFQLGLDIAAIKREHPEAIGVILGGHGITAWGDRPATSARRGRWRSSPPRRNSSTSAEPAASVRETGCRAAAGDRAPGAGRRPRPGDPGPRLHRQAAAGALHRLGRRARVHRQRADAGAGRARHLLPGPLPAHQGPADGARPAAGRAARGRRSPGCASCTRPTAQEYRAYYERYATPDSPPMRGADPAIVLVPGRRHVQLRRRQADRPGRGGVLRQRDQRDARGGGDLGLRADPGEREVPDRVLGARGGQAPAPAQAEAAGRPDRAGDRRRLGDRPGDRAAAGGRGRLRGGRRPRRRVGGRGRRRARVGRRRGAGRRPT